MGSVPQPILRLARNHPFIDGNKRTAFQVMYAFLKVNGWELDAPEPEVVIAMQALAAGEMSENELAQWLRERIRSWEF